jgi:DNA-directed RNA polymerase III subunit RPC11
LKDIAGTAGQENDIKNLLPLSMLFCPFCSGILVIERQQAGNALKCKLCVYSYAVVDEIRRDVLIKPKECAAVEGEDKLGLAATCDKRCLYCDSERATFIEMQTRSADEPMTVFYQCVSCKKVWRE